MLGLQALYICKAVDEQSSDGQRSPAVQLLDLQALRTFLTSVQALIGPCDGRPQGPLSIRPRQHDRFVLIGLCWLYGRSEFPPLPRHLHGPYIFARVISNFARASSRCSECCILQAPARAGMQNKMQNTNCRIIFFQGSRHPHPLPGQNDF